MSSKWSANTWIRCSWPRRVPHDVRVSPARRDPRGQGWTACVRADLNSAMGKPLGTQTYRITISEGMIIDRRRVEAEDNCVAESYEPI